MKTKHTPGPWAAGRPGLQGFYVWRDVPGRQEIERTEANARLIAAAPDLLAALEMTLRAFNVEAIDPLIAMATIEKARAAIAKAKGDA